MKKKIPIPVPNEEIRPPMPVKAPLRRSLLWRLEPLAFIVILVGIGVFFLLTQKSPSVTATGELSPKEAKAVIDRVSKLILLSPGETPVIGIVSDEKGLRAQQPFYKDVTNGDYLLIYQKQLRAILYDPNADILVNVGAIQQALQASTSTTTAQ